MAGDTAETALAGLCAAWAAGENGAEEVGRLDGLNRCRLSFQATGNPVYAWAALRLLYRPAPLAGGPGLVAQYCHPPMPPPEVRPLPGWLADYLSAAAPAVLAPLLRLDEAEAAPWLPAWCWSRWDATGEGLFIWLALAALRPREGAILPGWLAAELYRLGRDLEDCTAGRDLAARPAAEDWRAISAWQARERPAKVGPEDILSLFGFPKSQGFGLLVRWHRLLKAEPERPAGLLLATMEPARVKRSVILAALGFLPGGRFRNGVQQARGALIFADMLHSYRVAKQLAPSRSGIRAAAENLGMADLRGVERGIREARRLLGWA
ncbi:hypothetical protein NON00_23210 [Roseomonas sp. GC11]|uniref:hypothetical protein n=1 Tax=Roseomonas sp. GC11 TaxID=2950546 RepID=UPI00210DA5DD|nr:hypothetical protein [Roseomonas sp. GC11]MCQ4162816.1 hypothetical protein [Roseomonas sp. GC11]